MDMFDGRITGLGTIMGKYSSNACAVMIRFSVRDANLLGKALIGEGALIRDGALLSFEHIHLNVMQYNRDFNSKTVTIDQWRLVSHFY